MNGTDCQDGTCRCRYCEQIKSCADFTPSASSPRGHTLRCRTCTRKRQHDDYVAKHPDYQPPPADIHCRWCGVAFRPKRDRATYCSNACRGLARRTPDACRVYFRACIRCAKTFASQTPTRQLCGPKRCDTLRHRVSDRCRDCGSPREIFQTYCRDCRHAHGKTSSKLNKQRRRAAKRSAIGESVNAMHVYERDGWMCGVCHRPVDASLPWPHPLSPSLDHVVPLALNGSHTYFNTQLAHLKCNLDKHTTPPAIRGKVRRDQVLF